MRGKDFEDMIPAIAGGITPACAGKSYQHLGLCQRGEDHPRVCGEKVIQPLSHALTSGSPPRVRGKVEPIMRFS